MAGDRQLRGTVTTFDDGAGLGELTATDGTVLPFHCTQIADGTRTIEVGATVTFAVVAGHRGTWEAAGIRPAG